MTRQKLENLDMTLQMCRNLAALGFVWSAIPRSSYPCEILSFTLHHPSNLMSRNLSPTLFKKHSAASIMHSVEIPAREGGILTFDDGRPQRNGWRRKSAKACERLQEYQSQSCLPTGSFRELHSTSMMSHFHLHGLNLKRVP